MRYLERIVRQYEHRRWAAEESRSSRAFDWGIEHIDGSATPADPRSFLARFAGETVQSSERWFEAGTPDDASLKREAGGNVLTFTSAVRSPWAENNLVHARYFPVPGARAAVVVLPQWNAGWDATLGICRWLNRLGMSALKMSLPYHDRRSVEGLDRDNFLVSPNVGLTLQANRQAVTDVRRCLRWLERQGYARVGLLGASIGSAIAFITAAHDPAVRAGAFLHVSTSFGEVVSTGMTTMHVWEPMRSHVSRDEIHRFWGPISPDQYVERLRGTGQKLLMISGRYDPTFWPQFSERMFGMLAASGVDAEILRLPCGHYSLDRPPFSVIAGLRFGFFLRDRLVH